MSVIIIFPSFQEDPPEPDPTIPVKCVECGYLWDAMDDCVSLFDAADDDNTHFRRHPYDGEPVCCGGACYDLHTIFLEDKNHEQLECQYA